jgi:hypothetical protein
MADVWVKVLTPANSYALLTLDELKAMLNVPSTNTGEDTQLQLWIDQYSDVVATMCNRVFAYETVEETWRGDLLPFDAPRLFLTRYPVADADLTAVESPRGSTLDPASYEIENSSGKLRIEGRWTEPVMVTYSGGYHLPDEAPQALKAATGLLIQAARLQAQINASKGVRLISHQDTRIQYFDPVQMFGGKSGSTGPLQAATDTVNALLNAYMRLHV